MSGATAGASDLQRLLGQARLDGPSAEQVGALTLAVARGAFARLTPAAAWDLVATALMTPTPSCAFEALRRSRALPLLLPEADALFGVPQLSDGPAWIDVGSHQWRFIDETARAGAPLAVRFAALAHKLGKAGTVREIWPHHHRHEEPGLAALDAFATRAAVPADAMALARLGIDAVDRLHRASDRRAGPMTLLLERLEARQQPARFEQLLQLCACDWAAYEGHHQGEYPKAALWRRVLAACHEAEVTGLDDEAALQARAEAVATALGRLPD